MVTVSEMGKEGAHHGLHIALKASVRSRCFYAPLMHWNSSHANGTHNPLTVCHASASTHMRVHTCYT